MGWVGFGVGWQVRVAGRLVSAGRRAVAVKAYKRSRLGELQRLQVRLWGECMGWPEVCEGGYTTFASAPKPPHPSPAATTPCF